MKNITELLTEAKRVKYDKKVLQDTINYIDKISDYDARDFIYDLLVGCDERFPRNAVHLGVQRFVNNFPEVMKTKPLA